MKKGKAAAEEAPPEEAVSNFIQIITMVIDNRF